MEELIIDVDVIIDNYNKKNPELKPMSRKLLAEKLEVNPQVFSDWKHKKTPKVVSWLFLLKEIGSCDIESFVVKK